MELPGDRPLNNSINFLTTFKRIFCAFFLRHSASLCGKYGGSGGNATVIRHTRRMRSIRTSS